jgi:hypothetical protein
MRSKKIFYPLLVGLAAGFILVAFAWRACHDRTAEMKAETIVLRLRG